jgi:hypothetical protein
MDLAIAACKSELLGSDMKKAETEVSRAKKVYGKALRFAGGLSFDVVQVSAFESRSIRLEYIISQLEAGYNFSKLRFEQGLGQ